MRKTKSGMSGSKDGNISKHNADQHSIDRHETVTVQVSNQLQTRWESDCETLNPKEHPLQNCPSNGPLNNINYSW